MSTFQKNPWWVAQVHGGHFLKEILKEPTGFFLKNTHGYLGGYFQKVLTGFLLKIPGGYSSGYFLKIPTPYSLGKRQAICFRTLNELPMDLLGNFALAPSDCIIVVCSYCSCFMTHFGLILANTIIHNFYSVDDSWPLLWPTIDPFLLSVRSTFSNDIHFLYNPCSILGSIVGFLQSFGWSVHITYPKPSTIYILVGTRCIP